MLFRLLFRLLSCLLAFICLPFSMFRSAPESVEYAYSRAFWMHVNRNYSNVQYVALDLSDVQLDDTTKLEEMLQASSGERGITILPHDMQWLVQEGYVTIVETPGGMVDVYWSFENGMRTSISSERTTRRAFAIRITSVPSAMLDIVDNYEARRNRGTWEVTRGESWTIIV